MFNGTRSRVIHCTITGMVAAGNQYMIHDPHVYEGGIPNLAGVQCSLLCSCPVSLLLRVCSCASSTLTAAVRALYVHKLPTALGEVSGHRVSGPTAQTMLLSLHYCSSYNHVIIIVIFIMSTTILSILYLTHYLQIQRGAQVPAASMIGGLAYWHTLRGFPLFPDG